MDITGDLLIGQAQVGHDPRPITANNPATNTPLSPAFVEASADDVNRAAELAWSAFDAYRSAGYETRATFLETIATNILGLGTALIERAVDETGLTATRIETERTRTVFQLRLFAEVVRTGQFLDSRIDHALPHRQPIPKPDLRLRQIPLGPVAVFGSSNFPLAFSVAGGDTVSALAAGCPVVVKGHPAHPGTSELVGRAVQAAVKQCGLPEGTFSLLTGGVDTGVFLVKHPRIKAVGFTGSRGGGLALSALAAARPEPIPVYAEMSSINPVYLLPQALKVRAEAIADAFVASLTLGAGQFCTNPGLVLGLAGPDLDRFMAQAEQTLTATLAAPMLTSGIHAAFDRGLNTLLQHDGVETLARGISDGGANRTAGAIFATDAETFLADPVLSHEVFGASSLVIRCRDLAQMRDVSEQIEGQLTATLQIEPEDAEDARPLLPVLERTVGRIIVNGWPTNVEVSPAMVHGGPYPATSDSRTTSVGTMAIRRFLRPVCYQNFPAELLPAELRD
jgi:NADP-dependent aldehyde dehydrogenase